MWKAIIAGEEKENTNQKRNKECLNKVRKIMQDAEQVKHIMKGLEIITETSEYHIKRKESIMKRLKLSWCIHK